MKNVIKTFAVLFLGVSFYSCSTDNEQPDAYGNFEITEVTVSSQATGQIMEIKCEEGQQVNKGDTLAIIDTASLKLKLQQVIKQIESVQSKLASLDAQEKVYAQQRETLTIDRDRMVNLLKGGAGTQKQLDDLNGAIKLTQRQQEAVRIQKTSVSADVAVLYVQLEDIKLSLSRSYVVSPINGTVLTKLVEAGAFAVVGKGLFLMADMEELYLRCYVSEPQLPFLKTGDSVQVAVDKGKDLAKRMGIITWISDKAEFTPKTIQTKEERVNLVYAIKVNVKNKDRELKAGKPGELYLSKKPND